MKMKAVIYKRYGTPEVLHIAEVPKPRLRDNEVLVKIMATSVTQVDTAFRSGNPKIARLFTGLFRPGKPVLGTELAGIVEATGTRVTRFSPGDRVFAAAPGGFGAHAQFIAMSEDAAMVTMPDKMRFEEAAVIDNGALTALPFLRDTARLKSGQTILIIGASGSIGTYAVQLAAMMGAEVTGLCSTANLEMVRDLGAAHVIDYTKADFTRSAKRYDVIFDTVGKSSFFKARKSLAKGGIFLTTVPDPTLLLAPLARISGGGKRAKMSATGLRKDALKITDMNFLKQMMMAGTLVPVIDRSYPLEEIRAAHAYVENGHKRGNLVIAVGH
jgi:NADPH:quinone reductase-like Zn-dependent oxidoreductase